MISFDISKDKPPPPPQKKKKKKKLLKYFVRKCLNVHRYFNEIVINKITLHVKKCQTLKKKIMALSYHFMARSYQFIARSFQVFFLIDVPTRLYNFLNQFSGWKIITKPNHNYQLKTTPPPPPKKKKKI